MTDQSQTTAPEWAIKAAESVIDDLTGRRGLGDGFDNIDPDIQEEIKMTWAGLIAKGADEVMNLD